MLRASSLAWVGLVAVAIALATGGPMAAETDRLTSDCRALLAQQWRALSKGDYDAADKTFNRARQEGCLQPPVAGQLCDIPADQEAIQDAKGNASLANIARNQQRLLGCEM